MKVIKYACFFLSKCKAYLLKYDTMVFVLDNWYSFGNIPAQ